MAAGQPPETGQLTKFDLNFPGGTPKELVAAIQKAMGKPVNVIVPDEYADTKLPSLEMKNVDLSQLFTALAYASGGYYGFYTRDKESDDAIWYFAVDKGPRRQNVCRFYLLAPYLERGLTVDDITTAIQTGWKMLGTGEKETPKISFHKETKLLIAVGEPGKLETIDAVLRALSPLEPAVLHRTLLNAERALKVPSPPELAVPPAPAQPKPAEESSLSPKPAE